MIKRILFFVIGGLYLLLASGWIDSIDGMAYVTLARNTAYYGKMSMPGPEINTGMMLSKGRDGLWYTPAGLGWSLMLLPAAFVAKFVYWQQGITPSSYFPLESDYLLTFLASFINPLLGWGLFVIIYKIFRRYKLNFGQAFGLALIVSLTTNLLPLAKHSFAHLPMIFAVAGSILFWKRYVDLKKLTDLWLSGMCGGWAMITYNFSFVLIPLSIGLVSVIDILILKKNYFKVRGRLLREIALYGLSAASVMMLMFYYNYWRFGNILSSGYQTGGGDFIYKAIFFEGAYGMWLSSGRGMLIFSPMVLSAVIVSLKSFKVSWWSRVFLLMSLVFTLFYGNLFFWSGELSYGPRYLSPLILFAGLAIAENWNLVNKFLLVILALIGGYVQLVGVVIPYQTQYPPYDSTVYVLRQNYDRKDLFDYWTIGEFVPRYSPPYRLKRMLISRLKNIGDVFFRQNSIELVDNVSPPIKKDEMALGGRASSYKNSASYITMYSFVDQNIESMTFNLVALQDIPVDYQLCSKDSCLTGKVLQNGDSYSLQMKEGLKVKANQYLRLSLSGKKSKDKEFKFDIKRYSVNQNSYSVDTYRLVNTDNLFWNNSGVKGGDLLAYWKIRDGFQQLVNITPDFWWIKTQIYFNLPDIFRQVFLALLGLEITMMLVIIGQIFKNVISDRQKARR